MHSGTFIGPKQQRVMFTELLENLERDYKLNGKRTLASLKGYLKHIRQTFGADRAVEVTETRIEKYKEARLEEKAAPGSVNRELSAISRAFRLGIEQKQIISMPRVKKLKEENVRQGFVERADFEAIASQLPPHLADFSRFAFLTGWRKGEVSSLTWADVDLKGKTVHLRPTESKNSQGRIVALTGELEELLNARKDKRTVKRKNRADMVALHVFHDRGNPVGDFRKAWKTARDKAALSGLLVHDLRRSAVRNLVRSGVPQSVCMKITGHLTEHLFRRYDIVDDRDIREAMERMQTYLQTQPKERKVENMPEQEKKQA